MVGDDKSQADFTGPPALNSGNAARTTRIVGISTQGGQHLVTLRQVQPAMKELPPRQQHDHSRPGITSVQTVDLLPAEAGKSKIPISYGPDEPLQRDVIPHMTCGTSLTLKKAQCGKELNWQSPFQVWSVDCSS